MNKHKIRGIDINVCCAEQKIAYNLASAYSDLYIDGYKKTVAGGYDMLGFIYQVSNNLLKLYNGSGKYDFDLIHHCLRNGLETYFSEGLKIYSSYEKIGAVFECLY